ncbi:phage tail protein [Serratia ureilytica]|uniref:phage tail protein n=1 Tax=Serratia ureilytica TaxID=300181 RepID=UPI0018E7E334|nr:phage tail protein [Serratia ureilytica]MBJ2093882.1 phage tail protein [Serratia ureilytica]
MAKYYSIITNRGAELIANAIATGEKVNIAAMAVGDGQGELPTPSPEQTELLGEQYRALLNSLKIYPGGNNTIMAEIVIPAEVGGFWVREAALFTADGEMLAVGNVPETYKPELAEGSGRVQTIRMVLTVSSTEHIELLIDPSVVVATVQYVDEAVQAALNAAADAMEEAKRKVTFDEMYPVGDTKFFAKVIDPNKKWPGTLWYQLEENKTIRLAKKDGLNVMETGGSDKIKIAKNNLPAEKIDVSGDTNEHDTGQLRTDDYQFGEKETSESGRHAHRGRYVESNTSLDGGGSDRRSWSVNYGNNDEGLIEEAPDHKHVVTFEDHNHTMPAIKHKHSVTAKTEQLGNGEEISIVNSYITLYGWYRAA